ncbi:MAG: ATP-binding protein [Gammaproteobacteria bacterium]|nr:ATP-binding protein [Gammaproteobacteria bacterium]
MNINQSDIQAVLGKLKALSESSPDTAETAKQWIEAINEKQRFLNDPSHPVVFIGSVGVGKSSLIGVAAKLLIGSAPADKASLKNNSVLSIGAGRTTVCEVRIRAPQENEAGKAGILIEPVTEEEMKKEIAIYAETEWHRRQPDKMRTEEDDAGPVPREIQRVIRNMTNCAEYQETFTDGEKKRRRTMRPLDDIVLRFDSCEALSDELIKRADLSKRIKTAWWQDEYSEESLKALKSLFENLNQGKDSAAMLPRSMTVVVPDPLPGSAAGRELTLIDTRGLDGTVESRADICNCLRDSRAVIVLCTSFKDASGDSLRDLLRFMSADAESCQALPHTLLVLLDQGDAEQVNDADGDREYGQELKIDECHRILESTGLPGIIDKERIIAFDVLKDDRKRLQITIDNCLSELRRMAEEDRDELIENAKKFLENAANKLRPGLCNTVDEQLKQAMARHPLSPEPPLHDPLAGLYGAIRATRYASVVYATCRRSGAYFSLNLYTAVQTKALQAASVWLKELVRTISDKLDELKQDSSFALVYDHIELRKRQYQETRIKVIRDYAFRVTKEVRENLMDDSVWNKCVDEWGRGTGFKDKVLGHLEDWGSKQQGITAHETANAETLIPLLAEIHLPIQAPQFTIHVRNLRMLRQADWTPEQLSVVIGANGAGKTTLLQVLRLLRIAYERDLSEAVTQVLGGSSNLKTWGISEKAPVEIGLDIGAASWRIQLVPREGSVNYLIYEHLTDQGHEIFSRDALKGFFYDGVQLEPGSNLGLRTLMDRGVHKPALRIMASFFQRIAAYYDPDLWSLRRQGSNTSENRVLDSRGVNALALLRRWHQERASQHRYRFVIEGLAAAFPNTVADMDFIEAGNTLAARIYRPGQEQPSPLADEANGVLQLLVLFCNVASVENESVVAIDEPENSLHPYALRAFLRRTGRWARQHNLTVLLATHSTAFLDELRPEQVYVMKADQPGEPVPTRLDQLCNPEWLEGFKLGDLYEQGEIGSNEDED